MIEFIHRHLKYLRYLARHKYFVYKAGRIIGTPLFRLLVHDWSKFMPQEWYSYMNFFYPNKAMQEATNSAEFAKQYGDARYAQELAAATPNRKLAFRLAFNHHLKWNKHHWQYWAISSDDGKTRAQEMPEKYIREMVADWFGAGRGISGKWDADIWYTQHKDMLLAPKTRRRVEELLKSTAKVLNG
jgi:hypothetical protein